MYGFSAEWLTRIEASRMSVGSNFPGVSYSPTPWCGDSKPNLTVQGNSCDTTWATGFIHDLAGRMAQQVYTLPLCRRECLRPFSEYSLWAKLRGRCSPLPDCTLNRLQGLGDPRRSRVHHRFQQLRGAVQPKRSDQ